MMSMKRPDGYPDIIALVFAWLGIAFTLLGLIGLAIPYPMRSGERWMFGVMGVALILAAVPFILTARRQRRLREELRRLGWPVRGRVVSVKCHDFVHWTSGGFNILSPWTVLCEYQYEGQSYTVRSTFLWDKPVGKTVKIFLDQLHPERAWVDPKSLQYKLTLR